MKKTISIISLGCPRNLVDSEKLIAEFTKKGYRFQEDIKYSDIVIVNTCAFIEEAKKESIDSILRVIGSKKEGKVKKIIVAGCLSERYKNELSEELKEIDEFRGVLNFNKFFRRGQACLPPTYKKALLYLLLSQTSCFRYWGTGVWTDYAKEICRRGMEALK